MECIEPSRGGPTDGLERTVLKEIPFPENLSPEMMDQWAEGIPAYPENDPGHPEWRPTRCIPLDLTSEGYGEVLVKDESDPASNPTRTIKDRPAWETAGYHRDTGRCNYLSRKRGTITEDEIRRQRVPRLSLITGGNEGIALATIYEKYGLPPPKLIIHSGTDPQIVEEIMKVRADIYMIDLDRKELTPDDILRLSDNPRGLDLTSSRAIDRERVYYDWHVHEVFALKPDEIYVPYGSSLLWANYLHWQKRTVENDSAGSPDPRLKCAVADVIKINVLGAKPVNEDGIATKLRAKFRPFLPFRDADVKVLADSSRTGKETGVYGIQDDWIKEAHALMRKYGVEAEPSAAAGLALYLKRFEAGNVDKGARVVIVNTGIGPY